MTERKEILVRVVYGQGGKGPASAGLIRFADRLRNMGYDVKDNIDWSRPAQIAALFDADDHMKRVFIGYSLGANCLTWVSNLIGRSIDLGVAYDPSWGVPVVMPAPIEYVSTKIKRCLHYRGIGFPVGGATLTGPTVETVSTWIPHIWVDSNEGLHARTLGALARLEQ